MESLIGTVGSGNFPRLRFGIGRPGSDDQMLRNFVLGPFEEAELAVLPKALERARDALECFLTTGIEAAMDRYNAADG